MERQQRSSTCNASQNWECACYVRSPSISCVMIENSDISSIYISWGVTKKPEQTWLLKDGATKIQLNGTNLCIDAGTGNISNPLR